jgi:hypothetical protein
VWVSEGNMNKPSGCATVYLGMSSHPFQSRKDRFSHERSHMGVGRGNYSVSYVASINCMFLMEKIAMKNIQFIEAKSG